MKKAWLFLALILTSPVFAQQVLTPEILWSLKRISDPQLSHDGKTVLFNVRNYSIADNKGNADVYLLNLGNGNVTPLCTKPGNEYAARWAGPDAVSFLGPNADGQPQLFLINTDGSGLRQITSNDGAISNYGFAPAGNMLWYTRDVKVDQAITEKHPDLPLTTGRIYDDLMYRHWTEWEDGHFSHLFIQPCENYTLTGSAKDLMDGERYDTPMKPFGGDEQIAWNHDGTKLAYTCKKLAGREYTVSTNSDIYLYDVTSGSTANISEGMMGYDVNPRFSPDGKKIMWLSMATPKYESDRNRIMWRNVVGGAAEDLTAGFDYTVQSAEWSRDGKRIYFLCAINATDQVWTLTPSYKGREHRIRQLTRDVGDHTALSTAGSGRRAVLVTTMMNMSMPSEIFRVDPNSGESTQVTYLNEDILSQVDLGEVRQRMVKATDGKNILTWVIYPPEFDSTKTYPALLYCQGGPQSTISQFFSYRWNFQIMAASGYVVVAPNRRGLPSFGTEWNRQISGDWGGQCMKDYLSAIDDVSGESYVDADNLGCVGASFGGYSVFWLMGHHEKRFKAMISHCGVFNLKSMYGTTEELWFPDFDMGGPYWKDPENVTYNKFSPNDYINNWDTPLLIIHNEKDFRVPLGQGMEAFTAARLQDVPARFLYFPDEGHWVQKPQNGILWQRVFFEWLDSYLK